MICDWDDFHENNHRLDLLEVLKQANPAFKCTLFAIPTLGSDEFWASVPDWCELAMHGWHHGDPPVDGGECKKWYAAEMHAAMQKKPERFVRGFRAPGWQISQACFIELAAADWWVADKDYNDWRRPKGLRVHRDGDGDHWHGHIQDVEGNGLEEAFAELLGRVREADSFQFVSEVVQPWVPV